MDVDGAGLRQDSRRSKGSRRDNLGEGQCRVASCIYNFLSI